MSEKLCFCGLPLHYTDPEIESHMMKIIKERGEYITIHCNGKSFRVPRHYIALHGLIGKQLENLGFEEIK